MRFCLPLFMNMAATVTNEPTPRIPANHGRSRYKASADKPTSTTIERNAKNIPHQFMRPVLASDFLITDNLIMSVLCLCSCSLAADSIRNFTILGSISLYAASSWGDGRLLSSTVRVLSSYLPTPPCIDTSVSFCLSCCLAICQF